MRRFLTALTAAGLALGVAAASPSSEQEQRTGTPAPFATYEMSPGDAESVVGQAPGGFYLGLAAVRDAAGQYPDCSDDVPGVFYCESVLVAVSGGEAEIIDGVENFAAKLTFNLTPDTPAGDFDIRLFKSDESGVAGEAAGATQELVVDSATEKISVKIKTNADEPVKYYLAVIDYWVAVGSYSMDISVE